MLHDHTDKDWSICPHQHWVSIQVGGCSPWVVRSTRVGVNEVDVQIGQYGLHVWRVAIDRFRGIVPPAKGMGGRRIRGESCAVNEYELGVVAALQRVMSDDMLRVVARRLPSFEYELEGLSTERRAAPGDLPGARPPFS